MKHTAVIYHRDCLDGFTAAWAAWKKFGAKAEYFPVEPEVLPDAPLRGKDIFILDNSYPGAVLAKLVLDNRSVTVIDHHISARPHLARATKAIFDNGHSGCVLAWQFFQDGKPLPKLCRYVEDVDLWRFAISNSRAVAAAIETELFIFERWNRIAKELESVRARKRLIERGSLVLEYQKGLVQKIASRAEAVIFAGRKTFAVNSPVFSSEIGAELVKRKPPIGIVWREQEERLCVSLRSDGSVNVADIAQRFRGGGHRAASGFCLPIGTPLPWKRIKQKKAL